MMPILPTRLLLVTLLGASWLCAAVGTSAVGAEAQPAINQRSRLETMRQKLAGIAGGLELPLHLRGGFSVGGIAVQSPAKIERTVSAGGSGRSSVLLPSLQRRFGTLTPTPTAAQPPLDKDVIERSIDIHATPEEVFQVATRFEQYPEWAGVTSINVLERGRDGLGKSVKLECGMFGRSIWYTLCYSYERPKHMRWFASAGSLKELVGSYEFQPLSGGTMTRVVYKLRVEPGFYLPSVIKSSTSAFVATAALSNLKRFSELPSTKLSLRTLNNGGSAAGAGSDTRVDLTPIWSLCTLI